MGHVGDGDPERAHPVLVHEAHRVVEIFGVGRVDGHQRKVAQVGASSGDFTVTVHFGKAVGVGDQSVVVGSGEGVETFAPSGFKTGVEQGSGGPTLTPQHQQGHRGLRAVGAQTGPACSAFRRLFHQVKTEQAGAALSVQGIRLGNRSTREHGFPHVLQQTVASHVVRIIGVLVQRRAALKRGVAFGGVTAEEILPLSGFRFHFGQRFPGTETDPSVLLPEQIGARFAPFGQRFVHLAEQGASGFGFL